MALPNEFVIIDESGRPRSPEHFLTRPAATEVLRNLKFAENGALISKLGDKEVVVEAFDEPLIGMSVEAPEGGDEWTVEFPFELAASFSLASLSCDEWDRFHGLTEDKIPFVLSSEAQNQLFDAMESFTDDSLSFAGKTYQLLDWLGPATEVERPEFWSELYQKQEAGWDLGKASPILKDLLPRLKIPKSRILVLGSGPGHDAAHFAEQGHVVTAVDMSPQAIALAKKNYPLLKNISWVEADLFRLSPDWHGQFDIVFEHTCYCAINPKLRNELVKTWLRLLAPQGHLLAVFFAMEKRQGPPFGGSEWEIRERLKRHFQFVFWGRWRQSEERRQGKELAVYSQKK